MAEQILTVQGVAETKEDRQRSRNLQAAADAYDQANNKVPCPHLRPLFSKSPTSAQYHQVAASRLLEATEERLAPFV